MDTLVTAKKKFYFPLAAIVMLISGILFAVAAPVAPIGNVIFSILNGSIRATYVLDSFLYYAFAFASVIPMIILAISLLPRKKNALLLIPMAVFLLSSVVEWVALVLPRLEYIIESRNMGYFSWAYTVDLLGYSVIDLAMLASVIGVLISIVPLIFMRKRKKLIVLKIVCLLLTTFFVVNVFATGLVSVMVDLSDIVSFFTICLRNMPRISQISINYIEYIAELIIYEFPYYVSFWARILANAGVAVAMEILAIELCFTKGNKYKQVKVTVSDEEVFAADAVHLAQETPEN